MGKNKISVSIAGSEFVVTTDEEREYTLSLARTVDSKIRGLLQESTKLTAGLAAILTCLDLCDENEKNKESCARLRDEIRQYLAQVEAAGMEQQLLREEYGEKLEKLEHENELLRNQLAQYEAGQIGFHS
ncbi:MAG: cell division protein ZapA [Clostridia bacterium]|nr:cell division protein ZapA [Clostridia bacterium]